MEPMHVFFFRGISTYGHDHAQWSVFNLGPVSRHLERELKNRNIILHPVLGMGAGRLPDIIDRAHAFVKNHPAFLDPKTPVGFLGHSAGGLVLRALKGRFGREAPAPGKIRGMLTIATPHLGSGLAEMCLTMDERYRSSHRFLKMFGYDLVTKRDFFGELTARRLKEIFSEDVPGEASIVCSSPRDQWCWPLRALYRLRAFDEQTAVSDGFVEREAQVWGRVWAELPIDHFRQVGLFDDGKLFARLCDEVARYFLSVGGPSSVSL